jgi:hypothetical protein
MAKEVAVRWSECRDCDWLRTISTRNLPAFPIAPFICYAWAYMPRICPGLLHID